ncbi:MAG: ribose 5-phosphate isomerase B [Chitinophagaceae bacterium]|nr:ribose 5-phosphate isomerase B [Chitinophagaceae bacterium]
MQQKISIGSDHAGFEYKVAIINFLSEKGFKVLDQGCYSLDSVDYPDFAHPVADDVDNKRADFGILICGSAQGVAITANKHQHVRAAVVWRKTIAELSRQHNDANIICLPARFVSLKKAIKCISLFLETPFEGGRHQQRVDKISC